MKPLLLALLISFSSLALSFPTQAETHKPLFNLTPIETIQPLGKVDDYLNEMIFKCMQIEQNAYTNKQWKLVKDFDINTPEYFSRVKLEKSGTQWQKITENRINNESEYLNYKEEQLLVFYVKDGEPQFVSVQSVALTNNSADDELLIQNYYFANNTLYHEIASDGDLTPWSQDYLDAEEHSLREHLAELLQRASQ